MEAVDDVSADDHLGGGEVFEGVVLASVGGEPSSRVARKLP
ncbi:hypothetical protein ACWGCK_21020 [Streptomyces virginiae]